MAGDRPLKPGIDPWSGVSECADRCWPDVCREGGWSDFAFAVRAALGSLWVALALALDGDRPSPFCSKVPLTERGMSLRPSSEPIGKIPGPTLFRGARAVVFCGVGAGNWLCRLVRMAMLVVGSTADVLSTGTAGVAVGGLEGFVMPGLRVLDWLKRRMNELLRAGYASVSAGCMLGGAVLLKLPGAGKALKSGS